MNLGQLIKRLEGFDSTCAVRFDFCNFVPKGINSWRGDYSHLAIGYGAWEKITVGDLLGMLVTAVGKTYGGYKGGDYVMDTCTPVWVDNWGEYTRTTIKGIIDLDGHIVIETGYANDGI